MSATLLIDTKTGKIVKECDYFALTAEEKELYQVVIQDFTSRRKLNELRLRSANVTLAEQQESINSMNAEMRRTQMQVASANVKIESLQNAMNEINAERARNLEIKNKQETNLQYWTQEANNVFLRIEQLRHALFFPNELHMLRERFEQAMNLGAGASGSLVRAYDTYNEASDLYEKILESETQWETIFAQSEAMAEQITSISQKYETLSLTFETEEGTESIDAEIDRWSKGELTKINHDTTEIRAALQAETVRERTTEEILQYHNRLAELGEQLLYLPLETEAAIQYSQRRAELAVKIASALENSGWSCDYENNSGYGNEDNSKELYITLTNPSHDAMTFVLSPEGQITIASNFRTLNKDVQETLQNNVIHLLQNEGVEIAGKTCEDQDRLVTSREDLRDVATLISGHQSNNLTK